MYCVKNTNEKNIVTCNISAEWSVSFLSETSSVYKFVVTIESLLFIYKIDFQGICFSFYNKSNLINFL